DLRNHIPGRRMAILRKYRYIACQHTTLQRNEGQQETDDQKVGLTTPRTLHNEHSATQLTLKIRLPSNCVTGHRAIRLMEAFSFSARFGGLFDATEMGSGSCRTISGSSTQASRLSLPGTYSRGWSRRFASSNAPYSRLRAAFS